MTTTIEQDLHFLIEVCELDDDQVDNIMAECEKLNVSPEYYLEEFTEFWGVTVGGVSTISPIAPWKVQYYKSQRNALNSWLSNKHSTISVTFIWESSRVM